MDVAPHLAPPVPLTDEEFAPVLDAERADLAAQMAQAISRRDAALAAMAAARAAVDEADIRSMDPRPARVRLVDARMTASAAQDEADRLAARIKLLSTSQRGNAP